MVFWDHSTQQHIPTQTSIPPPRFRKWLTFGASSSPGAESRALPLKVPGSWGLALPRREGLHREPTDRNTKAALMGAGTAGSHTEPGQGEAATAPGVPGPSGGEETSKASLISPRHGAVAMWVIDVIYLPVKCPVCILPGRKPLLSQFLWV